MLNKHHRTTLLFVVSALLTLSVLSVPALAGNKKLMTVNAAKAIAKRGIVESVIGLKIRSRERVEDMIAQSVQIDAKTSAAITGIEFVDIVYDAEKDIAQATAQIRVGRVANIIGRRIDYGDQTIRRVGFATSTPEMAAPLQALRAAELDAYRNLAEQIVGLKIRGETSVENFVLRSDEVQTKMMAAIYGAELANYRWDEQGDAYVTLRMKVRDVEDVLGQRLDYQGHVIEVEGAGSSVDDFSQTSGSAPVSGSTVREGSLAIPVIGAGTRESQTGGGGAAWRE